MLQWVLAGRSAGTSASDAHCVPVKQLLPTPPDPMTAMWYSLPGTLAPSLLHFILAGNTQWITSDMRGTCFIRAEKAMALI